MPKQIAKIGDVFWVPIDDGSMVLGQVVEINREVLNSITCAFYDVRKGSGAFNFSKPVSVQFVTKDLFNKGVWARDSNTPIQIGSDLLPYRETAQNGWVGAKVIGSGIMENFLSAFFGLRSWSEMHDPNYYEKLLLPGVQRHGSA